MPTSGVVRMKDGVSFSMIAPAGFAILSALVGTASIYGDMTITSGTDGSHSGPDDPHHHGEAFDVRSKVFDDGVKTQVLLHVMGLLMAKPGELVAESGGYVTEKFFGWIEQAGTDNEHFHFQKRHGVSYP